MPMFDSFDPDGGQASFFAPLAGAGQDIGGPQAQALGQPQSTYPDIPGAVPAPNQTASGYYPYEPTPQRGGIPFPQDLGSFPESPTMRSIDAPQGRTPLAGEPGYDPAKDPQIPAAARAAPGMSGSVTMGPGGRPVYDPGGQPPDPRIQTMLNAAQPGAPLAPGGIDLRKQGQGVGRPDFGQPGREFGKREKVLGPIRQDIEKDLSTPRPSFQEWAQQNNMPSRPPNYEEWKQQHNHSILQGMGPAFVMAAGAMMILGAAFGGRSSGARLAGIQGMSGLVNGFSSGNREAAQKGLSQMRESFSEMQRLYEDSRQAYNDAMTAKDKNIDQKYRILQLEASKFQDMAAYQAATQKRMEFFDRMNIQRENQALRISEFFNKREKEIRDFEWTQKKAGWAAMQTEARQARIENDNAMRAVAKADNDLRLALQAVPQNAEAVERLRKNSEQAHAHAEQTNRRKEASIAKLSGQDISPTEQTGSEAQAQPLGIPQEAIDDLKKNPSPQNREHFDAAFQQPGAADRILGPAEGESMPAAEPPTETYSSGGEF